MKLLTAAAEWTWSWLISLFNFPVILFYIHKLDIFQ